MYPPPAAALNDGRGQRVEHDLVGNEIAAGLVGRDLAACGRAGLGFGSQQVTGGDVPYPPLGC